MAIHLIVLCVTLRARLRAVMVTPEGGELADEARAAG
jgi:hypothetical protein